MKPAVELIYDPDCPNVEQARIALRDALAEVCQPPVWLEWSRQDTDSPDYVQGFGSPTILVDGRDVAGVSAGEMPSCCRVYENDSGKLTGAPSAERIVDALRDGLSDASGSGDRAHWSGMGASFALAGLCPVCWTAYAGLFGSLGIGFVLDTAFLLPVTLLLLAVALFALGFRAPRRRGYGPLGIGTSAAAIIVFARFVLVSDPLTFLGLVALVGASVWNIWPLAREAESCPACVTGNGTS